MDPSDLDPRIMRIELPLESTATYRVIHRDDGDGDTYAVRLTVSVGIDGFIERELWNSPGGYPREIRVDGQDRMRVEIHDTTLQEVSDRLDDLTAWLIAAVRRAAEARREASLEDDRLRTLEDAINQSLKPDR